MLLQRKRLKLDTRCSLLRGTLPPGSLKGYAAFVMNYKLPYMDGGLRAIELIAMESLLPGLWIADDVIHAYLSLLTAFRSNILYISVPHLCSFGSH